MIYKLIRFLYRRAKRFRYILFKFILPNKRLLCIGKILLNDIPSFNQTTLCNGKGVVEIGKNCSFGYRLGGFYKGGSIELQARYKNSKILIGNNVATNNNLFFCAANYIEIGDNTLIGQYVTVMDHEAHGIDPLKRRELGEIKEVIIGKNVWIGNNVTILKGVHIGDNSIIANGSVVTKSVPLNVIVGGIPAKIIRHIG
jgi:acetyltransferase-like isoleucine patch superfamily enzyme